MKQKKQSIEDLIHRCVQYFEQQSFSQLRIDRYKYLWKDGIVRFMAEKSVRHYKLNKKEKLPSLYTAGEVSNIESSIIREGIRAS